MILVSEQLRAGLVKISWTYVVAEFRQSHQFTIYFWSCRFSFVNNFSDAEKNFDDLRFNLCPLMSG